MKIRYLALLGALVAGTVTAGEAIKTESSAPAAAAFGKCHPPGDFKGKFGPTEEQKARFNAMSDEDKQAFIERRRERIEKRREGKQGEAFEHKKGKSHGHRPCGPRGDGPPPPPPHYGEGN